MGAGHSAYIPAFMPESLISDGYLFNGTLWEVWDLSFSATSEFDFDPPFTGRVINFFSEFTIGSPNVFVPLVVHRH
jgi:hypothetical protein